MGKQSQKRLSEEAERLKKGASDTVNEASQQKNEFFSKVRDKMRTRRSRSS